MHLVPCSLCRTCLDPTHMQDRHTWTTLTHKSTPSTQINNMHQRTWTAHTNLAGRAVPRYTNLGNRSKAAVELRQGTGTGLLTFFTVTFFNTVKHVTTISNNNKDKVSPKGGRGCATWASLLCVHILPPLPAHLNEHLHSSRCSHNLPHSELIVSPSVDLTPEERRDNPVISPVPPLHPHIIPGFAFRSELRPSHGS